MVIRDAFHRRDAVALRRSLERPAPARRRRGWPAAMPTLDAFDRRKPFDLTSLIRSPFTRTLLPARSRFSGSRRRPTTSATEHDTRAHPASPRSSHASEAFDPAARRHQPMPVALATTMRCRMESLRATTCTQRACTRCVPLAWTGQVAGRRTREKAGALLDERCACPSRSAPCTRVTRTICSEAWTAPRLVAQVETHPVGAASRKAAPAGEVEVLSAVSKPVREPRGLPFSCAPGSGPRHATSAEVLLWGSRASLTMPVRLPLTRQAPDVARPAGPEVPKHPLVRRVAAPVTASTIDSARG
jgi:hypothetical protein